MFGNAGLKSLEEKVVKLEVKLGSLENQCFGNEIEGLKKANHELALKLSNLKGKAALIGLAFGALTTLLSIIAIDNTRVALKNIHEYEKFEVARDGAYDVLLETYQNKLADTIDRISLNEPSTEDQARVNKLSEMQRTFSDLGVTSEKFKSLSGLTNALKKMVIENKKEKEASDDLNKGSLPTNSDNFVAARALTLKAMALVLPTRQCSWPEGTKPLVEEALKKDSGVAAAFNLLGMCLTKEAEQLIEKPQGWEKGNQIMQDARMNYHLAYDIKPTTGTKLKLLNNKVWADTVFLHAALGQKKLTESLPRTGYETFDKFFAGSLKDLVVCQDISREQAVYWETEAELYGLRYAYFKEYDHDDTEASKALAKMRESFAKAINLNLYKRLKGEPEVAISDLRTDKLLQPIWYDERILQLIRDRVSS